MTDLNAPTDSGPASDTESRPDIAEGAAGKTVGKRYDMDDFSIMSSKLAIAISSVFPADQPIFKVANRFAALAEAMTELKYGDEEPRKTDCRGLLAPVTHVNDQIDPTIWAKFCDANNHIRVEEARTHARTNINYTLKPTKLNDSDSFFRDCVTDSPEFQIQTDRELSSGEPPESLSETLKLARALAAQKPIRTGRDAPGGVGEPPPFGSASVSSSSSPRRRNKSRSLNSAVVRRAF